MSPGTVLQTPATADGATARGASLQRRLRSEEDSGRGDADAGVDFGSKHFCRNKVLADPKAQMVDSCHWGERFWRLRNREGKGKVDGAGEGQVIIEAVRMINKEVRVQWGRWRW